MSAPDLTEFANHIRNVFSQRPDTTYYDLPSELMKDFRLTNVEDAESFIDEFADQEEVKITLIAAGWRYGTQKEEEEVNSLLLRPISLWLLWWETFCLNCFTLSQKT